MSILTRIIDQLTLKEVIRPPAPSPGFAYGATAGIQQANRPALLNSMDNTGWIFAIVDRIATAVASSEWTLWRRRGQDWITLEQHPLLDLWNMINPFYTRHEFLELSIFHFELVGEIWWVLLRNGAGRVEEIWPLRPDRMSIVADPQEYIRGYLYKVDGHEPIFLPREDVIFIRRPHPFLPYRGIGPVQSIMADLNIEKNAANWTLQFFRNDAAPGGVIQLDDTLSDDEFKQFVERWRWQHQGVSNAHRVAIIEKAKWVDRKMTQRDMQFEQLRRLNRDIILGAFGIHKHILGIADDVNRANAEAAEVHFARWIVRPRSLRLREEVNQKLVPDFGPDLAFGVRDQVPEDRALNLQVANDIYRYGYGTQNESRVLVGLPELPTGGDDFFVPGAAAVAALTRPTLVLPPQYVIEHNKPRRLKQTLPEVQEDMAKSWEGRFQAQLSEIIVQLTDSEKAISNPVTKFDPGIVDSHDWDWWHLYGESVIDELTAAFEVAVGGAEAITPALQRLAAVWAETRAGLLLSLDGEFNVAQVTRERVRVLVAEAIKEGESLGQLERRLRADNAFSRSRAEMVARTETATALGQGSKQLAIQEGQDEKMWITQGDALVTADCAGNQGQGWIPIDDIFSSGKDTIPQHPRCLIGDTHVLASGISAASKRWYDGQIVILRTASGNELTCTPNHPILTGRGWVPARFLKKGDCVVSRRRAQRVPFGYEDDKHTPATIEEIADTFRQTAGVTATEVPLAPEDFHSDGIGSQIAIIWANRLLGLRRDPTIEKHHFELPLDRRDMQPLLLDSETAFDFGRQGYGPSLSHRMGSAALSTALLNRHAVPLIAFSGTPVANGYTGLFQSLGDRDSAYPIPNRQLIDRLAGEVFMDELIQIGGMPFSGHVYNLETQAGLYVANSIVTHNCRCNVRYRTRALSLGLGDARCPGCNHVLGKNILGGDLWCDKCKKEVSF